jgi:riboflavin synthase
MFTGLVREVGTIASVGRRASVTRLEVLAPMVAPQLVVGASLAVNGVCLTVTGLVGPRVRIDVSDETRRVSTASRWRRGDRVHLEPALLASDALGGHLVLGHVDGVGIVRAVRPRGDTRLVSIDPPPGLLPLLLPKGSIAVDGVSLTLDAGPFTRTFTVTLIPQTLRSTRFSRLAAGDRVNLETDVLAKAAGGPGVGEALRGAARTRSGLAYDARSRLTTADILSRGWHR